MSSEIKVNTISEYTGAAGVNMAQGTASKQPVLITGANVRTGVI